MDDNLDMEALDGYLSSDDSPENCMMLSDLDGFIHGVICSPEQIPSEEWMHVALGGEPDAVPPWVIDDITDLYMGVAQGLMNDPPNVEPIFWQAREGHVIAMDWCEGFMQAVALRPREWLRLTESGADGHLIAPMVTHMLDDNGNSLMGIPHEKLDQALAEAADAIPDAVAEIFLYWRKAK
jgi:uncharacterized protein